jgi:hypothetical protein
MSTAQNKRHEMSSRWEEASAAPREWVEEYPLSSTLVAFGVGLGIGVFLGQSLSGSRARPSASMIEKLGEQVLQAVRSSIPESFSRHLPS